MRPMIFALATAALLASGPGFAQSTQTTNNGKPETSTTQSDVANTAKRTSDAASINGNPAVATTSANATTPAHGSNSFTMNEAKARLERNGYANVGDLKKDDNGVWHGQAQKGGNTAMVWLDYKGNTGEGGDK